ncbi:electron transport complex subunit RsxC [Candidatus Neomarinimicrobiota bacterium]
MRKNTFKKGIHPEDSKAFTSAKLIESLPPPENVFIPLLQHIGAPCTALVEPGAEVKIGQIIGTSDAYVSSPIHATISGKVKVVDRFAHPAGGKVQMIHIINDYQNQLDYMNSISDWKNADSKYLLGRIKKAGIVGLGGAAFPTHVKLAPPDEKQVDTFILNGCECEPFLTADHRIMVEEAEKIVIGMAIMMRVLEVEQGIIGIESNKPDAVKCMSEAVKQLGHNFSVLSLKTKYPQGAEKMLIQAVLKRQVPTGGLPMDVGVVVNNVGTALAVAEAVIEGKPLIERVVTVTGDGIKVPKNIKARIGTPFGEILKFCNGLNDYTVQVIMGGPMMGIAQTDLNVPIVKATSGIICSNTTKKISTSPCIRCGSCVTACPMFLLPTRIARLAEIGHWNESRDIGIMNCIECGSCAFACPSNIPLVQWIRLGKLKVGELSQKTIAYI